MTKFFFLATILSSIFHRLLMAYHNCPIDYKDCFNCTTCGETEIDYEECLCQWDSKSQVCKIVTSKPSILYFFQAFSHCTDTPSTSIQETYCGTSFLTLDKEFTFSMPHIHGLYGTQSVYCEYIFQAKESENTLYNINYKFHSNYTDQITSINLYLIIQYSDYTTASSSLQKTELNKDFFLVKEIYLRLYFEHGFPSLPFSFVIKRKTDNSRITLYITIGVIFFSCIICAFAIYCLSKKISENARLRQRALFEIAIAHQNGEDNDNDNELAEQKRLEEENQLKIKFALKHSLKAKKFLKKDGIKGGNTCTICIEDFKENKSRVSITPCKHIFHYQCLNNWLSKNVMNPKCPNCNYNLIQDVKDSDIQTIKINPERINVNSIRIHNIREGENSNNNGVNPQNEAVSRNINVETINGNTEERDLRTSTNQINRNTNRNN